MFLVSKRQHCHLKDGGHKSEVFQENIEYQTFRNSQHLRQSQDDEGRGQTGPIFQRGRARLRLTEVGMRGGRRRHRTRRVALHAQPGHRGAAPRGLQLLQEALRSGLHTRRGHHRPRGETPSVRGAAGSSRRGRRSDTLRSGVGQLCRTDTHGRRR